MQCSAGHRRILVQPMLRTRALGASRGEPARGGDDLASGGVAQLVRACGSYPQCRWFESTRRYYGSVAPPLAGPFRVFWARRRTRRAYALDPSGDSDRGGMMKGGQVPLQNDLAGLHPGAGSAAEGG